MLSLGDWIHWMKIWKIIFWLCFKSDLPKLKCESFNFHPTTTFSVTTVTVSNCREFESYTNLDLLHLENHKVTIVRKFESLDHITHFWVCILNSIYLNRNVSHVTSNDFNSLTTMNSGHIKIWVCCNKKYMQSVAIIKR